MLRSRIFTPGFKLYMGLSAFLFTGALIFGVSSSLQGESGSVSDQLQRVGIIDSIVGPMSLGWKGGVGNHLGYLVLLGSGTIAAFIAGVLIAFRDADPEAEAQLLQVESVPLTRAPSGANFAPIVGAFGLALLALGWIISTPLFYAGIVLMVLTGMAWTVRTWAERATGDPEVNRQIYARIIDPLRVPVIAVLVIGFIVIGISQLLIALPNANASRIVFGLAGVLMFGGVLLVYRFPNKSRLLGTILIVVAALVILGAGIYGIVKGARPTEGHGTEQTTDTHSPAGGGETHEGGLAPIPGANR